MDANLSKVTDVILVPLDGSERARQMYAYVRVMATTLAARVHLVHVVAHTRRPLLLERRPEHLWTIDEAPQTENGGEPDTQMIKLLRQNAENYLDAEANVLRAQGLHVTYDVLFGAPAECIINAGERLGATMIMMMTQGYGGLHRWAVGSITDKVVHGTNKPVFVLTGSMPPPSPDRPVLKRILVPLDGSAFARQALPIATRLATQTPVEVRLLRVIDPIDDYPAMARAVVPASVFAAAQARACTWAEQHLNATVEDLHHLDIDASTHIVVGHPAEMIVAEARACQSDLIVMATHGYTGWARWTLGSIADKVLHASGTPLILVRGGLEASKSAKTFYYEAS